MKLFKYIIGKMNRFTILCYNNTLYFEKHYYIPFINNLKIYYKNLINLSKDAYLFHHSLFNNIIYYINIIFKIFKFSLMLTIVYRLAIILNIFLGFDIILAYHNIDNDMLIDIINNIYTNIIIHKNQYLQWLVDILNSFITSDNIISEINTDIIESNLSPADIKIESSSNTQSLRSDYKDTIVPVEVKSPFYQSPYFYIPAALIISGVIGYQILQLWNSCIDAYLFNISPPEISSTFSSAITSPLSSASPELSDYFNSPELPLIDLASPEGSPTPKGLPLELTEYYYPHYVDPFNPD